jgi:hypothetical protein
MRHGMRERFARHDPRAARCWELVGILNGKPSMAIKVEEWNLAKQPYFTISPETIDQPPTVRGFTLITKTLAAHPGLFPGHQHRISNVRG